MAPILSQVALERLASKVEARSLFELLRALQRVRAGLPLSQLERALLVRNIDAAIEAIGLEPIINAIAQVRTRALTVAEAAFQQVFAELPASIRALPLADLALGGFLGERPDVRAAIERASGTRITAILEETRTAIREILQTGLEAGTPPRDLARQIRPLIGLTRRQAAAVVRYREILNASQRPDDQIDRMVHRYATKQLRLRAENIARTETLQALNEGKRIQFDRLQEAGVIDRETMVQEWLTAADDRTCPICQPLHGKRVDLGELWQTAVGALTGPPAHPRCRCIVRLQPRGFREGEPPNVFRQPPQRLAV